MFCSSEVGAEHVATTQALLATCRAHGVNCYDYLVDVFQRIDTHPGSAVHAGYKIGADILSDWESALSIGYICAHTLKADQRICGECGVIETGVWSLQAASNALFGKQ